MVNGYKEANKMTDTEIIKRFITAVKYQELTGLRASRIDKELRDLLKKRVVIDVVLAESAQFVLETQYFDKDAEAMQLAIDRVWQ